LKSGKSVTISAQGVRLITKLFSNKTVVRCTLWVRTIVPGRRKATDQLELRAKA
jgi:hypothetical protein